MTVCAEQAGLTLGVGLGEFEGGAFRIGHMGHLNPPMVLGTLGTVEAALAAIGAPTTSSGVAAAAAIIAGPWGGRPPDRTRCQTAAMPTYLIVNAAITDPRSSTSTAPRWAPHWRAVTWP